MFDNDSLTETANWVLVRIYDNDPSKLGDLTSSEVEFYLEGWEQDFNDNLVSKVLDLHRGRN